MIRKEFVENLSADLKGLDRFVEKAKRMSPKKTVRSVLRAYWRSVRHPMVTDAEMSQW